MEPYPLGGVEKLDEWLESEPSERCRRLVLDWIAELLADPDPTKLQVTPVPTTGLPVYTVVVPRTDTAVSFCIIKSPPYLYREVAIVRIETLDF